MRVLDVKLKSEWPTFQPEMEIVLRIPLELGTMQQPTDESYLAFGKAIASAYNDYTRQTNICVSWKI